MRRDPQPPHVPSEPRCGLCGLRLEGDPDDRPNHPGGPLCGPCVRAREFDETLWELDLAQDGDLW